MKPTLLIAALAWLAAAGSADADAAVGSLTYTGCVGDTSAQGCVDLPSEPLGGTGDVAVSPDGRSVYAAGFGGDSIAHFFRDPATGALAFDGCLNNDGSDNCVDLPNAPLDGANGVAVSPDGRSVYVTAYTGDAVLHFFREPGGQLFYDGCVADDDAQGCAEVPGSPLRGAQQVAVSPDGASLYVAAAGSSSIARFGILRPGGQIFYAGCLNNDGSSECVDVPGAPLDRVSDVAVSPDGRSVYVAAWGSDSIGYLFRNPDGKLDWDGCLNNDGSEGCENVLGAPLEDANGVAVSPDGRSVYAVASASDALSLLARNTATGKLAYVGCLNNDGSQNCTDLPGDPIDYAVDVELSADGRSAYVASYYAGGVAHLFRNPVSGHLSWDGCLNDDGSLGCRDVPAPLVGVQSVAVSVDGKSVYAGAYASATVSRFARELPVPAKPGGSPPPPKPAADTLAPTISRLALARGRFRFRLSEPATVRIAFDRRRGRRRVVTRAGRAGVNRLRVKLACGTYRARFVAVDAAGNRSRALTLRFRVARR